MPMADVTEQFEGIDVEFDNRRLAAQGARLKAQATKAPADIEAATELSLSFEQWCVERRDWCVAKRDAILRMLDDPTQADRESWQRICDENAASVLRKLEAHIRPQA